MFPRSGHTSFQAEFVDIFKMRLSTNLPILLYSFYTNLQYSQIYEKYVRVYTTHFNEHFFIPGYDLQHLCWALLRGGREGQRERTGRIPRWIFNNVAEVDVIGFQVSS